MFKVKEAVHRESINPYTVYSELYIALLYIWTKPSKNGPRVSCARLGMGQNILNQKMHEGNTSRYFWIDRNRPTQNISKYINKTPSPHLFELPNKDS